ncbi:MAG: alpha/beta hydrolase fold domain-containing protein [Lachnospira sp.]|nr:alpha/beta hydrolase fold domain-containing protein [Lachnospira sp.]
MIYRKVETEVDYEALGIRHTGEKAYFETYVHAMNPEIHQPFHRPCILICPGGGYVHLSPREGEPIALEMMKRGFNAVVLHYSLSPNTFPCALYEAAWTIDWLRDHAAELDIGAHRIVAAGFSAGAHVAASLGTLFDEPEMASYSRNYLKREPEELRPDGLMLGYPVITSGQYAHRGSFESLLGARYDELLDSVSLERRVDSDTPKTFLWHTWEDEAVPVENSLLFAQALRRAGVSCELHIFPHGCHGMALATEETNDRGGRMKDEQAAVWPDLFANWVNHMI